MLELLVVLAVISLVAALAVVNWRKPGDGPGVGYAASRVAAALRSARAIAIRSNEPAAVKIDVDANRIFLPKPLGDLDLPREVTLDLVVGADGSGNSKVGIIRFFPDGSSSGGTVRMVRDGRSRRIEIDWLTGAVEVSDQR